MACRTAAGAIIASSLGPFYPEVAISSTGFGDNRQLDVWSFCNEELAAKPPLHPIPLERARPHLELALRHRLRFFLFALPKDIENC